MLAFLDKLFFPQHNTVSVTCQLLRLLKVPYVTETLKKELEEHPDFPSLLSVSDTLNSYKIENVALSIEPNRFAEVPVPFISQIRQKGAQESLFTVVKEMHEDTIYLDPNKQEWQTIPSTDFVKMCSGVVLLSAAEDNLQKGDSSNVEERRKRNIFHLSVFIIPVIVGIASINTLYEDGVKGIPFVLLLLLQLAGAVIAIFMLLYDIDKYNPVLKQVCSGDNNDCGAVLDSEGSKIAGVKWSIIGLVYFSGNLIQLLLGNSSLLLLSWLSILATPYIVYSVYYQWKVVKQWCRLCLATQVVLLAQTVTSISAGWYQDGYVSFSAFFSCITSFIIPAVAISILYPLLIKKKEDHEIKQSLTRFKHNPDVFNFLLRKQRALTDNDLNLGIILGNRNSKNLLVKVCSPYCGPCGSAHSDLKELLAKNPDLQVQIIFTAKDDETDRTAPAVKHLLAIDEKGNTELTLNALSEWFHAEKKDYDLFAQKFPMNGELKKQGNKLDAMSKWCREAEISFTPTIFFNGYQLPSTYKISDLKYFLAIEQ